MTANKMCFMLPSIHQEDYLTGFSTVNLVPRAFTIEKGTESPGDEVAQMFLVGVHEPKAQTDRAYPGFLTIKHA